MLATVLARPAERLADRVALWRQLIDLLAQSRPGADPALTREALVSLQSLREDVPVAVRRETARAFAGRRIPAPLVIFLAADVSMVVGAILPHVQLGEQEWLSILPRLMPTGRGFLRHRRDLGPNVEAALSGFGATDLALGETETAEIAEEALPEAPIVWPEDEGVAPREAAHGAGEGQIRAIITRIARFREERDGNAMPAENPARAEAFRFETGADGVIRWVEGASRGPLVGETIAFPASGLHGVDAQAPGAFRRRASFRDARMVVAGHSSAAGEWRIAGVPVFTRSDGRFLGYRGVGRRPAVKEQAEPLGMAGLYGGGLEPDSLRQLVHELRTPLNAIGGFAEMIRRQMRGPISSCYRGRAQAIAEHAGQLLAAVDDLDVAARLETHRLDLQRVEIDLGAMLGLICTNHQAGTARRGVTLECEAQPGLPSVVGDPAAVRRMVGRLIASCTALAEKGETIRASLAAEDALGFIGLRVSRPLRLDGLDEASLLDPGYGPEGDFPDAPLLGLGFSLHLVRELAATIGGGLVIAQDCFLLRLPGESEITAGG